MTLHLFELLNTYLAGLSLCLLIELQLNFVAFLHTEVETLERYEY
jgi:hypothetical protein